ncbi:hypothetical protein [Gaetbulibacter jejuensis]|uniref:hypothetical protein n=1 Tax=Gaetbulibacter jejuensis TaxID=584607 RepID=UPI0031D1DFAC
MKKFENFSIFILIVFLTLIIGSLSNFFLDTEQLLYNSLLEQLTQEQIEDILGLKKKQLLVSYFILPLFLLIKTSIIAAILNTGYFLFGKEIKYKKPYAIIVKL